MNALEDYAKAISNALDGERYHEAAQLLNQAVEAFPERPKIHYYHGFVLAQLGDGQGAKAAYERVLELYGEDRGDLWKDTLLKLGILLVEHFEDHAAALARFRQLLQTDPAHQDALYNAGSACQTSGRQEEARAFYRRLLERDPDNAEVRYNIGSTYYEEMRYAEALSIFQALVETNKENEDANAAVELCLEKMGRHDEAARHRLYRMKLAVP